LWGWCMALSRGQPPPPPVGGSLHLEHLGQGTQEPLGLPGWKVEDPAKSERSVGGDARVDGLAPIWAPPITLAGTTASHRTRSRARVRAQAPLHRFHVGSSSLGEGWSQTLPYRSERPSQGGVGREVAGTRVTPRSTTRSAFPRGALLMPMATTASADASRNSGGNATIS